jgi:predicted nucleic acid-binding protein
MRTSALGSPVREHELLVSVVCDYELRRELLRIRSARSLRRLDELTRKLPFIDLSVAIWRDAALRWAAARSQGVVTAAPDALDGDVLLGAQAKVEDAVVVTTNVKHFAALKVPALAWTDVPCGPRMRSEGRLRRVQPARRRR